MNSKEITIVGGPRDGEHWAVPEDCQTWRVIELAEMIPNWALTKEEGIRPINHVKWAIPIREDNTAHWADRRKAEEQE